MVDDEFVTDAQLEQRTQIKQATWRKWRSRGGKGPAYFKVNGRVLYRWADVLAWIESCRKEGDPK